MKPANRWLVFAASLAVTTAAWADKYDDAIKTFKQSPKSSKFFAKSYGYAVFPDIGKAGFIVGGEHGDGHVFEHGRLVGTASLTQVSVGAQAGAKEYTEIIFFHNKEDFEKFRGGDFQVAGSVEATAITLNASASAGTTTSSTAASTTKDNAATGGGFNNGVAVFVITKGGLMAGIAVGGQKIKFEPMSK
jgi:lipid-binding SYLF domain-containing protein